MNYLFFAGTLLLADIAQGQVPGSKPVTEATPSAQATSVKLDAANGFRDLKFGKSVTQIKGLVPVGKNNNNLQLYSRPSDSMKLGDATLATLQYLCYKGQFYSVFITTKGAANSQAALAAFNSLYGAPLQPAAGLAQYQWFGKTTQASYIQNNATGDAALTIISILLANSVSQEMAQDAARTAAERATRNH